MSPALVRPFCLRSVQHARLLIATVQSAMLQIAVWRDDTCPITLPRRGGKQTDSECELLFSLFPGVPIGTGVTLQKAAARTAGFAVLYLAATYLGRLTVMDDTNLSLVWPAAGVLAVWFLAQRESGLRWLDYAALTIITLAVNVATGATLLLAAFFAVANLVQGIAFVSLLGRWLPGVWDRPLAHLTDLWRLAAAALVSTLCGAAIGPTGIWLVNGAYSGDAAAVWLARNTVAILLISVAALQLKHGVVRLRPTELLAILVTSATAYYLVFAHTRSLPVAFALLALTVWVALRMHTTVVVLHDLVFGSLAVVFTLLDHGPFAAIGSHPVRALVAQLFVGTIAVVGLALALGRDEREALIAELRSSGDAATRQARLMTTIVESMTEGLAVIDGEGQFLMRNPAAVRLLGGVTSLTGRVATGSYYGMFHPDGSPIAEQDLPYRRALSSDQVQTMDILVRNAALPEGRILRFNVTRLTTYPGGPHHAVVVFHDVTADRRHRDELISFAGMVAHDLLNPLTTIEGWNEVLETELAGHPSADRVVRINRATARMRSFLNGLIAYTSARDGRLHPETINLYWLARDVATGYLDQAQESGAPVPEFEFGELDAVDADPVLVRQLLESLIGNAVKFTQEGVPPRISIASQPAASGLVRVDVTDNGIGIPAGRRDAVFSHFHRAEGSTGYAGTGLGLAICKRIVERHGGTITVASNPAGSGSRMTFTLPRARASYAQPAAPAWTYFTPSQ
uniref:histidine kinase n=1 Tax=uncultured bacterium BAC AB649/1850 TaxID=1037453 RepID=F6K0Z4_9BACT|nr:PAS/PAC sensor signal transduction histidine kinase [uncultured bacterium BAC AB649/1850]